MSETPLKSQNRNLIVNSLWRLAQILAGGGFAALFSFVYTVFLTKSDYAAYGVAFTLNSLFQLAASFGMRLTLNRSIATAVGAGEESRIRAYIRTGFRVSLVFSILTTLLTLALSAYLATFFEDRDDKMRIITVTAITVGAAGVSLLLQGALEGLGEFKKVMQLTFSVSSLQLILLGLLLLGHMTVLRIVMIECIVMLSSIVIYGVPVYRKYRGLPAGEGPAPGLARQMLAFGAPLFLNTVGGFLYTKVDVLFIKYYLTSNETADYFLMSYIFQFPLQALGAYLYVLNTEVAKCLGQKDWHRILSLFKKSIRISGAMGLGMSIAFIGASFVIVWVLPQYAGTGHLMRLISPMLVVKFVASVASGAFMVSLGKVKLMAALTISGGLLNVLLDYLFIPSMGVDGAVYSTMIGHTLVGMLTVVFVVRVLRRLGTENGVSKPLQKEDSR